MALPSETWGRKEERGLVERRNILSEAMRPIDCQTERRGERGLK